MNPSSALDHSFSAALPHICGSLSLTTMMMMMMLHWPSQSIRCLGRPCCHSPTGRNNSRRTQSCLRGETPSQFPPVLPCFLDPLPKSFDIRDGRTTTAQLHVESAYPTTQRQSHLSASSTHQRAAQNPRPALSSSHFGLRLVLYIKSSSPPEPSVHPRTPRIFFRPLIPRAT